MKRIFCAFLFFYSSHLYALETVPYVDPAKYVGRWYQQARNPMFFEPTICDCAQQTLTILGSGEVGVYNSCNEGGTDGPLNDIKGTAVIADPVTNAKFTVDFNLPFKGSYWIIGLDKDYKWAVVSDKNQRSLYILSKTPVLPKADYDQAIAVAQSKLPIDKLLVTKHENCTYPSL